MILDDDLVDDIEATLKAALAELPFRPKSWGGDSTETVEKRRRLTRCIDGIQSRRDELA